MIKHLCLIYQHENCIGMNKDRDRLDTNFIRLKNLIKLNFPIVLGISALVGICLMGSFMVSNSASNDMSTRSTLRNLTSGIRKMPKQSPSGNSTERTTTKSTVNGKPDAGNKTSPTATPSYAPTPSTALNASTTTNSHLQIW